MVPYRRSIVRRAVAAAADQPCQRPHRRRLADPVGDFDAGQQNILQAALDVDLAFDIGLTEPRDIAGQEVAQQLS